MANIVVFDIDKTITKDDFHLLVTKAWIGNSSFRKSIIYASKIIINLIPLKFIKRKLEYIPLLFISEQFLQLYTKKILEDYENYNHLVLNRLERYRNLGFKVILVTAAPYKTSKFLAKHLKVEVITSKSLFLVLYSDLLARKNKAYKHIERNGSNKIRTIYSDSAKDFLKSSKNILIENSRMRIVSDD